MKDDAHREIAELESNVDNLKGQQTQMQEELKVVIHRYLAALDAPVPQSSQPTKVFNPQADVQKEVSPSLEMSDKEDESDLSDLYEKVDIEEPEVPQPEEIAVDVDDTDEMELNLRNDEDDVSLKNIDEPEEVEVAGDLAASLEKVEIDGLDELDESPAIPDLDDDFMFTLEDPLDSDVVDGSGNKGKD